MSTDVYVNKETGRRIVRDGNTWWGFVLNPTGSDNLTESPQPFQNSHAAHAWVNGTEDL